MPPHLCQNNVAKLCHFLIKLVVWTIYWYVCIICCMCYLTMQSNLVWLLFFLVFGEFWFLSQLFGLKMTQLWQMCVVTAWTTILFIICWFQHPKMKPYVQNDLIHHNWLTDIIYNQPLSNIPKMYRMTWKIYHQKLLVIPFGMIAM